MSAVAGCEGCETLLVCPRHDVARRFAEEQQECGRSCGVAQETFEAVNAALERARVVAVLDGWCQGHLYDAHWAVTAPFETDARCSCALYSTRDEESFKGRFYGPTPDAARAAAARAIEAGEV